MQLSFNSPPATSSRKREKMVSNAIDMDRETIDEMRNGEWPISEIIGLGEMDEENTKVFRLLLHLQQKLIVYISCY